MALPDPAPGSTCLITGASAGIGVELARELARRGHGLTLVARRRERLQELADALCSEYGVRVEFVACDVGEPDERDRLERELADRGLTVEVICNNAGFGSGKP